MEGRRGRCRRRNQSTSTPESQQPKLVSRAGKAPQTPVGKETRITETVDDLSHSTGIINCARVHRPTKLLNVGLVFLKSAAECTLHHLCRPSSLNHMSRSCHCRCHQFLVAQSHTCVWRQRRREPQRPHLRP